MNIANEREGPFNVSDIEFGPFNGIVTKLLRNYVVVHCNSIQGTSVTVSLTSESWDGGEGGYPTKAGQPVVVRNVLIHKKGARAKNARVVCQ
ncbi:hypothetical protein GOV04_02165 [Candidatus Woesearchaeota archaeon]|nr:hypothetical protein [Candidatus Woesearchaeota archaeon]